MMFPSSLAVYLTNHCNLACRYCHVAVRRDRPTTLDFGTLRLALDCFLDRAKGPDRKISFLGGEPLLRFPLVRQAVEYIRIARKECLPLRLFTNGTCVTRERLEFLRRQGVEVVLSLDGDRTATDRQRIFAGSSANSVFDAVLSRMGGEVPPGVGVSLVFSPETARFLVRNVDFLYRLGFRKIGFSPDVCSYWSQAEAERLRKALEGLRLYYRAILQSGAPPLELSNIYEALRAEAGRPIDPVSGCPNLVLAADGRFHACDRLLALPWERMAPRSVGSASEGVDLEARRAFLDRALALVRSVPAPEQPSCHCPIGAYLLWEEGRIRCVDPADWMGSFWRVSDVFGGALRTMAREFKDHPAFLRVHPLPGLRS